MNALALEGIVKRFGATVALDHASFAAAPGEVHALLGENGAGKSTMVKLLSGLLQPDAGRVVVHGATVTLRNARDAHRLGIQTAFQEMTLVKDLTVAENMLLPYAPANALGQLRRRAGLDLVARHLERLGLGAVNPRVEVRTLDLSVRQKIEIARAIFRGPRILLLDEPTSTLSGRDIDWLGQLIADLKAQGITIVFISHRMPEVRRFCDRLTVLRNGKDIGTAPTGSVSDDEVIRMIIGRSLAQTFPPKPPRPPAAPPALEGHGLRTGRLVDASFALAQGEVLGIAGLQGMGQLELFEACFGVRPLAAGRILIDGRPVTLASPKDAVRANIGISLVPEDRKTEGLFLRLEGRANVSMPVIDRFARFGVIDTGAETAAVAAAMDHVQVDRRALYTPAGAFSGGNQQKIAIAKWLLAESRVLLMFDPTRGVDVGTKHELYVLIRGFAAAGGAVLLYSTEIPELVNLCDRVLVMYAGRMVRELSGAEITEENIMRAALGDAGMAMATR
ncbi:MAG: sugar ABC transporter ATP-binding protein [Rhodospirillaceae bacterium]|nr:sugar ABC transporter ATP-binding protein [Rhodospirillaceae bacterium]